MVFPFTSAEQIERFKRTRTRFVNLPVHANGVPLRPIKYSLSRRINISVPFLFSSASRCAGNRGRQTEPFEALCRINGANVQCRLFPVTKLHDLEEYEAPVDNELTKY